MKKSTKAALLSALIFPGLGHLILRRWKWGFLFMVACLMATGVLVNDAADQAMNAVDSMLSGQSSMDYASLQSALEKDKPAGAEAFFLQATLYLLLACWILAAVDAYIQGEKDMRQLPEDSDPQ